MYYKLRSKGRTNPIKKQGKTAYMICDLSIEHIIEPYIEPT